MAKQFPALTPIAKIVKTAARQQKGPLAAYACRSYPIPAPGPDGLHIRFLYAKAQIEDAQSPVWIAAPEYIVSIDAETGRTAEIRQFDPAEIGMARGVWLGQDHSQERRAQADFVEQEGAMLGEFDLVLPGLASGQERLPDEARNAAPMLAARFRFLEESPLTPYYEHLGRWFFGRLAEVRP